MVDLVDIGKIIRAGLERKGMANIQLAEIMEVGPSSVSMWLANKSIPPGDKLIKIAQVLDIAGELFPAQVPKEPIPDSDKMSETRKYAMQLEGKLKGLEEKFSSSKTKPENRELAIIVVEDEIGPYLMIQDTLHQMRVGCLVVHAERAEKAIQILQESKRSAALIILDLLMEGMGGLGFLDWLSKHSSFREIPVIIVTAADQDVISKALEYEGIFGVVRKPFNVRKLAKIVNKLDLSWPFKTQLPNGLYR